MFGSHHLIFHNVPASRFHTWSSFIIHNFASPSLTLPHHISTIHPSLPPTPCIPLTAAITSSIYKFENVPASHFHIWLELSSLLYFHNYIPTYDTFLESLGLLEYLGVVFRIFYQSQDDQEGKESPKFGVMEDFSGLDIGFYHWYSCLFMWSWFILP